MNTPYKLFENSLQGLSKKMLDDLLSLTLKDNKMLYNDITNKKYIKEFLLSCTDLCNYHITDYGIIKDFRQLDNYEVYDEEEEDDDDDEDYDDDYEDEDYDDDYEDDNDEMFDSTLKKLKDNYKKLEDDYKKLEESYKELEENYKELEYDDDDDDDDDDYEDDDDDDR